MLTSKYLKNHWWSPAIILTIIIFGSFANAFTTLGATWPNGQVEFSVNYQSDYDRAFVKALTKWAPYANLKLSCKNEEPAATPCLDDGINSYGLSTSLCGSKWNAGVLAVAINRYSKNGKNITDADVVINATLNWGFHSQSHSIKPYDFSRVAIHEIGHTLGMGHSDIHDSVIYEYYSDINSLQADDMNGIQSLYGKPQAGSTQGLNCLTNPATSLMPILSLLLLD